MNTHHQITDTTLSAGSKVASGMMYGGSATAIIGGLTVTELASVVGMVVGILGLIGSLWIQWYWKKRHYKLEVEKIEWDRRRMCKPVENDRRQRSDEG